MHNFLIKKSKIKEGYFYVECNGIHELTRISDDIGIPVEKLDDLYKENEGIFCNAKGVYYFYGYEKCIKLIDILSEKAVVKKSIKSVHLTEEEIEYIRRALINEDSNIIFTESKIRDNIFKKLNF